MAIAAAFATLLREHRQLRLRIDLGGALRDVRTPTLFVGNNRLQLEQVGMHEPGAADIGSIAAVVLRPIGTLAMLWLLLRGAFSSLGDAENVDHFDFHRMVVGPCCRMEGTASRSPATAKSSGCAGRGDYKRDVLKYGGYMARWVG